MLPKIENVCGKIGVKMDVPSHLKKLQLQSNGGGNLNFFALIENV